MGFNTLSSPSFDRMRSFLTQCNSSRGVLYTNLNSDVGFYSGGKSGLLFRDVSGSGEMEIGPWWVT